MKPTTSTTCAPAGYYCNSGLPMDPLEAEPRVREWWPYALLVRWLSRCKACKRCPVCAGTGRLL